MVILLFTTSRRWLMLFGRAELSRIMSLPSLSSAALACAHSALVGPIDRVASIATMGIGIDIVLNTSANALPPCHGIRVFHWEDRRQHLLKIPKTWPNIPIMCLWILPGAKLCQGAQARGAACVLFPPSTGAAIQPP